MVSATEKLEWGREEICCAAKQPFTKVNVLCFIGDNAIMELYRLPMIVDTYGLVSTVMESINYTRQERMTCR